MMPAPGSQPESKNKSQKEDTNDTSLRRIPCHPESKNGINLSIGIDLMAADFFLLYPTKINSRDIWLNSIYLTSFSFNLYEKPS
jgi:hypothetical protein